MGRIYTNMPQYRNKVRGDKANPSLTAHTYNKIETSFKSYINIGFTKIQNTFESDYTMTKILIMDYYYFFVFEKSGD